MRLLKLVVFPFLLLGAFGFCFLLASDEHLFEYLSRYTCFPYVLIGSKPMALEYLPPPDIRRKDGRSMLTKWWNEFYVDESNHVYPNHVLKQERTDYILLINKQNCLREINKNLALFQEICGKKEAQIITDELCSCSSIRDYTHNNETLLGILLGYGLQNAQTFDEVYERFCVSPADFGYFNTEELDYIKLYRIPDFRSLDNKETAKLRRVYTLEQKKISSLFTNFKARNVFFDYLHNE